MITLGINGNFGLIDEPYLQEVPRWFFHDASASVVLDGVVGVAVEEERLLRIKHTNMFPLRAIEESLDILSLSMSDIDNIAFHFEEWYCDKEIFHRLVEEPGVPIRSARSLIQERLSRLHGVGKLPPIHFVNHHLAHATSAHTDSGREDGLVLVSDGNGEECSASLFEAKRGALRLIATIPTRDSIGHLYTRVAELLGYALFDEYKVMGLASGGDSSRYRPLLDTIVRRGAKGQYLIDSDSLRTKLFEVGYPLRRRGEDFREEHRDLAATVQQVTEDLSLHFLRHWQDVTGAAHLAVSGGVGLNSTLNGKLLRTGLFDSIFVDPAPHDAGAAYGAALVVNESRRDVRNRMVSANLGRAYNGPDQVRDVLERWGELITWTTALDGDTAAAAELSAGAIVGRFVGRAEFGPRALGARSILADPGKIENRDRVNRIVKSRESYRPFAPAVTAENARTYFELPVDGTCAAFMGFAVPVIEEMRDVIPAVTHIDGTARVQTVARAASPRFWKLIDEFGKRSGYPVVLNTSFNNHAEPIVYSPQDALRCFLTTAIDTLVIEDFVVRKRRQEVVLPSAFRVVLMPGVELASSLLRGRSRHALCNKHSSQPEAEISTEVFQILRSTGGSFYVNDLSSEVIASIITLWRERQVDVTPAECSAE